MSNKDVWSSMNLISVMLVLCLRNFLRTLLSSCCFYLRLELYWDFIVIWLRTHCRWKNAFLVIDDGKTPFRVWSMTGEGAKNNQKEITRMNPLIRIPHKKYYKFIDKSLIGPLNIKGNWSTPKDIPIFVLACHVPLYNAALKMVRSH